MCMVPKLKTFLDLLYHLSCNYARTRIRHTTHTHTEIYTYKQSVLELGRREGTEYPN